MRLPTSPFSSMIVTVPIDRSIAKANDDASGSSVTSPPNLRANAAQSHTWATVTHGLSQARAVAGKGAVRVLVVGIRAHPVLDVEPRVVVAGDVVPVACVLEEARDE